MEEVTLIIALIASALVLYLKPIYGLVLYLCFLAWYPSYLTVQAGSVDFNVSRIVIIGIYAKLFLRGRPTKSFRLISLDKFVIVYFLCQILVGSLTAHSLTAFWINRGGAIFDTVLPYFAVRIIITTKDQYLTLLKGVLVIAAPLAMAGFYECITGENVFGFLKQYHAFWDYGAYVPKQRYSFFRAEATFPMSIMYGLFFSMLGPICAGLLKNVKTYKGLHIVGLGLMGIGVFSSMSSGPMLAMIIAILFIALYVYRKFMKSLVIVIILLCCTVEIISNRHFYATLDRFTLNPATAWYRTRLIEVVLLEGGMSGHWLTGFGDVDPGWGPSLGVGFSDVTNHYLIVLTRYGLVGLLLFAAVLIVAGRRIIQAYRASICDADRWLIWCLIGATLGIAAAMLTVSLFGQPVTIFYVILGFCGTMPSLTADRTHRHQINSKSIFQSRIKTSFLYDFR